MTRSTPPDKGQVDKKGAELTASKIKVKAEGNTTIDGEKILIG